MRSNVEKVHGARISTDSADFRRLIRLKAQRGPQITQILRITKIQLIDAGKIFLLKPVPL
jgi:hypothetical protein